MVKFGELAPCRNCVDGMVRGSGMDARQRRVLKRAGQKPPTMHPCPDCQGKGFVPAAIADLTPSRCLK